MIIKTKTTPAQEVTVHPSNVSSAPQHMMPQPDAEVEGHDLQLDAGKIGHDEGEAMHLDLKK